jgi:hypothetical protein
VAKDGGMSIMGRQDLENLRGFFQKYKASVMDSWFESILSNYPPEAARIIKREKDPFTNPVGYNLRLGMEGILNWFAGEANQQDVLVSLDKIIRIRAVQDFPPSQTVIVLISFKQIVEKQMTKEFRNQDLLWKNWRLFDEEIDRLMLESMDIYAECREKLSQIKVDEANKRVFSLLRKANVLVDCSEESEVSSSCSDSCNSCEIEKKEGCKNEFTS